MSKWLLDFYKLRDTLISEGYNYPSTLEIMNNVEKEHIVLEIIKEKRVNVEALFYSSNCKDYNKHYTHYEDLTQEEYELLVEVLL